MIFNPSVLYKNNLKHTDFPKEKKKSYNNFQENYYWETQLGI